MENANLSRPRIPRGKLCVRGLTLKVTTVTMKFLAALTLFALAVVAKENSEVTELKIESTYKPDDCSQTAAKGDKIKARPYPAQRPPLTSPSRCIIPARSTLPAQSSTPGPFSRSTEEGSETDKGLAATAESHST